jgi:hypothetical protein
VGEDYSACCHQCSLSQPISKIESLDFCIISESESKVVPFKFVCEHNKSFESQLFFLSFVDVNKLKKGIFQ